MIKALLGLTLVARCLANPLPGQPQVLAAYEKARVAARLHFVEGLLAIRAADFQAITRQGQRIDLAAERLRYASLFSDALRVRLVHQLGPFRAEGRGLRCTAEHRLLVEKFDAASRKLYTLETRMKSEDYWVETHTGWRMSRCVVSWQGRSQGPPMEPDLTDQDMLGRARRADGRRP